VIESKAENDFVGGIAGGDVWIGMSDHHVDQTYRWVTGPLVAEGVQIWQINQPDDFLNHEDCGELTDTGLDWNDGPCDDLRRFVCECDAIAVFEPATWCETGRRTRCDTCSDNCAPLGMVCDASDQICEEPEIDVD
jgi:hypothetical protein